MLTTGSKLFFGATMLSLAATIVVAMTMGGPVGFMAVVGLASLTAILAFVSFVNLVIRDGNVPSMEPDVARTASAAQPPVGRSAWPLVGAVAVAGIVAGSVSKPVVFKVSVIVLLAAIVEWMVLAWSERASGDADYNKSVRKRVLNPLEFPVLAALGVGAIIYSFSRIMLSAAKDSGVIIFVILGALVLGSAFLFAFRRGAGKRTTIGVVTVAAVALLGAGVVSAIGGQRQIEEHPPHSPGVCREEVSEEEMHQADEHAAEVVSAQASVFARVELQSDGTLVAFLASAGDQNNEQAANTLTIPRSAVVTIVFEQNYKAPAGSGHDDGYRLTAALGTFGDQPEIVDCTARVQHGSSQFLAFTAPKPNAPESNNSSSTPLELFVPGLEGQSIPLVVL